MLLPEPVCGSCSSSSGIKVKLVVPPQHHTDVLGLHHHPSSTRVWPWCHQHRVAAPPAVHLGRRLAALAGLDLHVGKLLNFGRLADVVEDGERLQVLGDTARRR